MKALHGLAHLSLRARFSLLILAILLAGTAIGMGSFVWRSQDAIYTLGGWFAERNVLYEKSQIIRALGREIVLVQKMATSPVLAEWARDERNPNLQAQARSELEGFRAFFDDGTYFIALARSGNYYYGDPLQGHNLEQPTYTLDPDLEKDAWFYLTLTHVQDYQLNVDTDRHLQTTKVWINAVLQHEDQTLAVLGTGLDLTRFLDRVMDSRVGGVTNVLIDRDGAIQAHRDPNYIDFASIRRPVTGEPRRTIFQWLDTPADRAALKGALQRLQQGAQTQTLELSIDGERQVAGLTDLPEIGWFLLTLTNPDSALDGDILLAAALVFALTLGGSLLIAGVAFDRAVLRPLGQLDRAAARLADGQYDVDLRGDQDGELGRLMHSFAAMARRIKDHTQDLKHQVDQRTRELAELAYRDHLTGHLNRRGLLERLEPVRNRLNRGGTRLGLLILDIDHFKACNDTYGHKTGDLALTHIAGLFRQELRDYDLCARWGGEEFLVAVEIEKGPEQLLTIAEKLRQSPKNNPLIDQSREIHLTVSIGACLADADEPTELAITRADRALYQAKASGRDRIIYAL